jgi:hypothetical protein
MKKKEYASKRLELGRGHIVRYQADKVKVSIEKHAGEAVFELQIYKQVDQPIEGSPGVYWATVVVANSLPLLFLDVKTPLEALDFLEATGVFLWGDPEKNKTDVTWTEFRRWQALIRYVMLNGFPHFEEDDSAPGGIRSEDIDFDLETKRMIRAAPWEVAMWLGGDAPKAILKPDEPDPLSGLGHDRPKLRMRFEVTSTIEAILAQIGANGLNGINFKLCARELCGCIFECNYGDSKKYHSEKCRNLDNVRRSRDKAKKKRAPKKVKEKRNG